MKSLHNTKKRYKKNNRHTKTNKSSRGNIKKKIDPELVVYLNRKLNENIKFNMNLLKKNRFLSIPNISILPGIILGSFITFIASRNNFSSVFRVLYVNTEENRKKIIEKYEELRLPKMPRYNKNLGITRPEFYSLFNEVNVLRMAILLTGITNLLRNEDVSQDLNQRRIKSAPADLTSSWSMTDKEMNTAPEGRFQIFSGLNRMLDNCQFDNLYPKDDRVEELEGSQLGGGKSMTYVFMMMFLLFFSTRAFPTFAAASGNVISAVDILNKASNIKGNIDRYIKGTVQGSKAESSKSKISSTSDITVENIFHFGKETMQSLIYTMENPNIKTASDIVKYTAVNAAQLIVPNESKPVDTQSTATITKESITLNLIPISANPLTIHISYDNLYRFIEVGQKFNKGDLSAGLEIVKENLTADNIAGLTIGGLVCSFNKEKCLKITYSYIEEYVQELGYIAADMQSRIKGNLNKLKNMYKKSVALAEQSSTEGVSAIYCMVDMTVSGYQYISPYAYDAAVGAYNSVNAPKMIANVADLITQPLIKGTAVLSQIPMVGKEDAESENIQMRVELKNYIAEQKIYIGNAIELKKEMELTPAEITKIHQIVDKITLVDNFIINLEENPHDQTLLSNLDTTYRNIVSEIYNDEFISGYNGIKNRTLKYLMDNIKK